MSSIASDLEGHHYHTFSRLWKRVPLPLKRAWAPFLISRILIALILTAAPLTAQVPVEQWTKDDTVAVRLSVRAFAEGLRNVAISNDAGWYHSIAHDGYEERAFDTTRQANWAFFPLYPLLWRGMSHVTGEWVWSGVFLSNACFLVALTLLWQLARRLTESEKAADYATIFAAFWPSTYFSMFPYTESLFFALTCLSALAASQAQWAAAGIAGGFASAVRFNGLFLAPLAFMEWWKGDRRPQELLKVVPVATGTFLYMAYLWVITGNPFAFKDIQETWGRDLTAPWNALAEYTSRPHKLAVAWNPRILHFGATIVGMCSVATCWRKAWYGLAVFTALTLLAPLSTGTLTSMTRYAGVAPGVFLALAVWSERSPRFGQICTAILAASMTLLCVMFSLHVNLAGS